MKKIFRTFFWTFPNAINLVLYSQTYFYAYFCANCFEEKNPFQKNMCEFQFYEKKVNQKLMKSF